MEIKAYIQYNAKQLHMLWCWSKTFRR